MSGVLEHVVADFNSLLVELQEASVLLLRHDGEGMCEEDVKQLNDLVDLVEGRLATMEQLVLDQEKNITSLDAAIESAKIQQSHLKQILDTIPAHKPSPVQQQKSTRHVLARQYIKQEELDAVSSYMKGRLTVDKINMALDELARHAESNAELVQAAKRNKTSGVDRKHAMWLLTHIARHPSVAGTYFALDADLKSGVALKTDKTSKSILTVLRHLRRIKEVRISVEGHDTQIAYIFVQY